MEKSEHEGGIYLTRTEYDALIKMVSLPNRLLDNTHLVHREAEAQGSAYIDITRGEYDSLMKAVHLPNRFA